MKKKILIGSIIAVVILVLVSFTGVVGYQTTKSSTIAKASPLFTVRCSRAIDEESKGLNCEYVGKGKPTLIIIPERIADSITFQKVIETISKMDEETFNKLLDLVIYHLQQKNIMDSETVTLLEQLRNEYGKPVNNKNLQKTDSKDKYKTRVLTGWLPECITISGFLYCLFWDLFAVLFALTIWFDNILPSFVLPRCT